MKKGLLLGLLMAMSVLCAYAQTRTITGKVIDGKDGAPLPGVTIAIKGTQTGVFTKADGTFTVDVSSHNAVLIVSFIGYLPQEINTAGKSSFTFQLKQDTKSLQEVIVTAQGITRDKRALGYAVQTVGGDEIAQKAEPNVLNTLAGKVAGVNITSASGAPGSSTNINIRGITSFSGNNQPLIVVDGIIFSNALDQTEVTVFGSQPGNRLNDISPENVESVTVLKGPAAAALYGSRASSGAILITTKAGKSQVGKSEVTLTSSVSFQDVYGLPKFQNEYGQGANNDFVNTSSNSWGPKFGSGLDSVTTVQGDRVPYRAYPNNVRDFYKRGSIIQNGVNMSSGTPDNNISVAVSTTFQNGIIPFSEFNRNSIQLGGNKKLQNGLKISSSITYVRTTQEGTPMGNGGSAFGQLTRIPRSYDLMGMPYKDVKDINESSIYYNVAQNHPMWSAEKEQLHGNVNRLFGFLTLGFDITKWLNVSYRATADVYSDRRKLVQQLGSARAPDGNITEDQFYRAELNGDLMIKAHREDVVKGLNISALLGQNINHREFQNAVVIAEGLTIPKFFNVANGSVFTSSQETTTRRRLIGYYGQLNFSYMNYLFLDLTGRMDQSSTLPVEKNKYFYPSAALSFVPTDAFHLESDILSYAKLRVSAAKVGRDADPYLLQTLYQQTTYGNNTASISYPLALASGNIPGFQLDGRIGSMELTPEFITSYEGGFNVGLFKNRVSLDATYFYTKSANQIFNVSVSPSSGFNTRTTNVGLMENKGVELMLNVVPVKSPSVTWEISANYTRIRNKVIEIAEGVESSTIIGDVFGGIEPSIAKGYPYGVIIGSKNVRSPDGQLVINGNTGLLVPAAAGEVIADPNPRWFGALINTVKYKNFTLNFQVDTRQGGDIYSFSMIDWRSNGSLEITGKDREQPRIMPGVIEVDGKYVPNNIQISAQSYWAGLGGLASEGAVFDATMYRLREVSLYYNFPSSLFGSKSPIGSLSLGVSAHNLYFYAPHFPGDPETNTQGAGNIQGLDLNGAPNTRNYGVNLRVTF
jgi:TonB-linked SusC/RagA family outer membrane protein